MRVDPYLVFGYVGFGMNVMRWAVGAGLSAVRINPLSRLGGGFGSCEGRVRW